MFYAYLKGIISELPAEPCLLTSFIFPESLFNYVFSVFSFPFTLFSNAFSQVNDLFISHINTLHISPFTSHVLTRPTPRPT